VFAKMRESGRKEKRQKENEGKNNAPLAMMIIVSGSCTST
jgi:hypothetical protein